MNNHQWLEASVSVILIVLGILLLNPFSFWMPDMVVYCSIAIALAAFGVLGVYVVRENGEDERAIAERSRAGRYAYLVGAGILVVGILYQGWIHAVDPWLVVALGGMLGTKLLFHTLADRSLR